MGIDGGAARGAHRILRRADERGHHAAEALADGEPVWIGLQPAIDAERLPLLERGLDRALSVSGEQTEGVAVKVDRAVRKIEAITKRSEWIHGVERTSVGFGG